MAGPFQHGSAALPGSSDSPAPNAPSTRSRFPHYHALASSSRPTNFYEAHARARLHNANRVVDLGLPGDNMSSSPEDSIDMDQWGSIHQERKGLMMPSFSRAFNMLKTAEADRDRTTDDDAGEDFFIPSYLQRSTYAQRLGEAHKAKMKAREASKSSSGGLTTNSSILSKASHSLHPLPPGSYRGMSHTVVERPPPSEEEDNLAPLPTQWNKNDQGAGIEVQPDGLTVRYSGLKGAFDREYEACAVRTDHPMPPQCGLYYYEVKVLSANADQTSIGLGFATKVATLSRPVGWEPETWGYHGDDGRSFTGQQTGKAFGPSFGQGDTIGCGINFRDGTAFFTKNGAKLGIAFSNLKGKLYPIISLKKIQETIQANFGQHPFVYNIDDVMKDESAKLHKEIQATDTSFLVPGMNENDLAQNLVLQFLQHDGYVGAARAFAEEIRSQKQALNLDPDVEVEGINIKDDEDANNRQRIRSAILEGDIDQALKDTDTHYPDVLKDNELIYFRLRCRKFIEMVQRAAQLRTIRDSKGSKKSNGHAVGSQDMDLDVNGSGNPSWAETTEQAGGESLVELAELETKMLNYGQWLHGRYKDDTRKEKALMEIWSLVAYPNPLKEPQVSHLLDKKSRVSVAEELNSAILMSLGKSSRAALETLYAQTVILLDELRQDGGDGAFISIEDVTDVVA